MTWEPWRVMLADYQKRTGRDFVAAALRIRDAARGKGSGAEAFDLHGERWMDPSN